jgi:hypothetical protein
MSHQRAIEPDTRIDRGVGRGRVTRTNSDTLVALLDEDDATRAACTAQRSVMLGTLDGCGLMAAR